MWLVVVPVYVVLVGTAVGGIYLLVHGPALPERIVGAFLLLVAYATHPRPGKLPRHSASLRREDAPLTFELLDDIAEICGTRTPSSLLVTRDFNAFALRVGWRRRSLLGIGAPLWVAAPAQARVALLGHELGHFAHGDLMSSWWVWGARQSLLHWVKIFRPPRNVTSVSGLVTKCVFLPLYSLAASYLWLVTQLNGPASQRQEYLADVDAARAAGTSGATRMLEVLFVEPAVATAMTRAAVSRERPDMWELVRADVSTFDDGDYLRRRAGIDAERNRVDATHPATVLRLRLLEALPPSSARVALDAARTQAIDAELAGPLGLAARHAGDAIRYQR
jgi:heat shock protein HtpX